MSSSSPSRIITTQKLTVLCIKNRNILISICESLYIVINYYIISIGICCICVDMSLLPLPRKTNMKLYTGSEKQKINENTHTHCPSKIYHYVIKRRNDFYSEWYRLDARRKTKVLKIEQHPKRASKSSRRQTETVLHGKSCSSEEDN